MARGQKFNDDVKEQALAMLTTNNNMAEVSRQLGIKESTLRTWKKEFEASGKKNEFDELRKEKKKEFIEGAWRVILLAQAELQRALELSNSSDVPLVDLGKLATVLGVMYDKQALASNDSTVNVGGKSIEEFLRKVQGEEF